MMKSGKIYAVEILVSLKECGVLSELKREEVIVRGIFEIEIMEELLKLL